MHVIRLLIILFFIAWNPPVQAQNLIPSLTYYGTEDGLPHREVLFIYQDSRGFMWFGTPSGLCRFDGVEFNTWTKSDGIDADKIVVGIEDSEGYLWLLNDESGKIVEITLIHTVTGEVLTINDKFGEKLPFNLSDINGKRILKDEFGTIYLVDNVNHDLISYRHDEGFKVVSLEFNDNLELIAMASDNSIWANLAKRSGSYYNQKNDNLSGHFDDMVVEIGLGGKTRNEYVHKGYTGLTKSFIKGNELWYHAEALSGLGQFYKIGEDRIRRTVLPHEMGLNINVIETFDFLRFFYLSNGGCYVAPGYDRLLVFSSSGGLMTDLNEIFPELRADRVLGDRGFFVDADGRVWMGGDFGVYVIDIQQSPFERHHFKDLSINQGEKMGLACRGIEEINGEIFVATEGKDIVKLKSDHGIDTDSPFKIDNINGMCWALTQVSNGAIYTSSYPYLSQLSIEDRNSKIISTENNIDVGFWSIYEQKNGSLLMGDNWSGLKTLDPAEGQIRDYQGYNDYDELRSAVVLNIKEDNNGDVWLSTNKGLYSIDTIKGVTARYWSGGEDEFKIPADNFQHFHHDSDGIYWLATGGQGLIRWDKENDTIQQITTSSDLPNDVLYAVYEDAYNTLWLSSDYGIIQFDKPSSKSRSFLVKDGITHEEFNRISHFQETDGTIYFGGLNGVTSFHPRDFRYEENSIHPPLRISKFEQFDGDQNSLVDKTSELIKTDKITLSPDDVFFMLRFALLSYDDIENVRYAYQIEGIDKSWIEQKENSIRLSRLPYGNYTLKVKGQSADGTWSNQQLDIELVVLRPYYLQWWFIILATTMIGLGIYWLYRFNLHSRLSRAEATRLKDLDSLKTRLYSYISHEFRTPLTVIMGIADNIDDQPKERELIKRNSENLLYLVNQLLDLSKLDAGGLSLNIKQADIISYLHYLIESFYSLANEKNLRLTFDSEVRELEMDFDEVRIQQIIFNLVSNAIKFTNETGIVAVFARQQIVDEKPFLNIRVKDSGMGIPEEEIAHVFDRFYQVDGTNTRQGEGTGVGLALTKEIVELLNGSINVDSKLGEGTAFIILLPITQNASPAEAESKAGARGASIDTKPIESTSNTYIENGAQLNSDLPLILIVEDNADVALYIKTCLVADYNIEFAVDGQEGINKAIELIPDVVISDVMMPKKDGYELTAVLKSDQRTSHIPVIILTAKAAEQDKVMGLDKGADAYLMKPFNKEELLVRIRKLIELRKTLYTYYANLSPEMLTSSKALNPDELFVKKIYSHVNAEIANPNLKADDLCKVVALSQAQLFRKIKALTGKTPALYVRSIRLNRAMQLLKKGQMNVSEVAYEVGFSEPNYFSRVFTQEFKQNPGSIAVDS